MTSSGVDLALVTIGQAPRPDLTDPVLDRLPAHLVRREVGLLDGLTREEVEVQVGARPGRPTLITRLQDGASVTLEAEAAEARLQRVVTSLDEEGAEVIAVLCTGEFPSLTTANAWLVEPDRLVVSAVRSLVRDRAVGIVLPLPSQIAAARGKWTELGGGVDFLAGSPFDDGCGVGDAARALVERGAGVIVLDCMAFGARHREQIVAAGVEVPVLISAEVFAHAIAPLFADRGRPPQGVPGSKSSQ